MMSCRSTSLMQRSLAPSSPGGASGPRVEPTEGVFQVREDDAEARVSARAPNGLRSISKPRCGPSRDRVAKEGGARKDRWRHPCVGNGFRSTFRDWCGDHGVQREIAEAALGHVVPGVEGDYRRRDALTLRRQLMQKWADFVDQPWQDGANVIRIGAA